MLKLLALLAQLLALCLIVMFAVAAVPDGSFLGFFRRMILE